MKLLIDEMTIKQLEQECQRENKYYFAGVMNALGTIKKESQNRQDVKMRMFTNQYENVYRCSHCNADFHNYGKFNYNFCPYCGSRVIGIKPDYKIIEGERSGYFINKLKEQVVLNGGTREDVWKDKDGNVYVNEPYASQFMRTIADRLLKEGRWTKEEYNAYLKNGSE